MKVMIFMLLCSIFLLNSSVGKEDDSGISGYTELIEKSVNGFCDLKLDDLDGNAFITSINTQIYLNAVSLNKYPEGYNRKTISMLKVVSPSYDSKLKYEKKSPKLWEVIQFAGEKLEVKFICTRENFVVVPNYIELNSDKYDLLYKCVYVEKKLK